MNRILKLNLAIHLCASLLTIAHARGETEGARTRKVCVTNLHRELIRLLAFFLEDAGAPLVSGIMKLLDIGSQRRIHC